MAYHHAALVALAEEQEEKQDVPPLLVVSNIISVVLVLMVCCVYSVERCLSLCVFWCVVCCGSAVLGWAWSEWCVSVCECVSVGVFCSSLVRISSLFLLSLKSNGVCHVTHGRLDCTHGGVLSVHTVRLGRTGCG